MLDKAIDVIARFVFGALKWVGAQVKQQRFIEQPPIRPRRTPFPKDIAELTLVAAWRFAEEGERTLIFCIQRDHAESYAEKIVDLSWRAFLPQLLTEHAAVERT